MATTKVTTAIWSSETFTAGSAHADSTDQTLDDGYGGVLGVKITNGATGPTVALQLQVRVSGDDVEYYDLGGPLDGGTTNSGVTSWAIEIPIGVEYLRIVSVQTNTAQNVTVDADITEVTAV